FFSSRRRHTRFSRDWSSDVCSSDLGVSVPNGHTLLPPSANNFWKSTPFLIFVDTDLEKMKQTRWKDVWFLTLKPPSDRWNLKVRSEEHTSELQSRDNLVCRLLLY